jgi:y4mF family transcriptional regulator
MVSQDIEVKQLKPPDRDQDITNFVLARRKANRLTQRELATLAGVGMRFISELEGGKTTLRLDTVNAVLRPFGKRLGVVDLPRQEQPRNETEK